MVKKLKIGLVNLFCVLIFTLISSADDTTKYSVMRTTAEKNFPIYTDAYAKNVKGITYGLGLQGGMLVPPMYNLGSTSRKSFDGNKLLGYFQPGAGILFYVNANLQGEYQLSDKFERTFDVGNSKVTLKVETKELPILPTFGMTKDDASSYQNSKVYFVTMDIVPMPGAVETVQQESSEWFDPTLRYNYETQVRALKDKYLSGLDLDSLDDKQLEDIARRMSAERREIGIKFKSATPAYIRENNIYPRNMAKYGDKYGPTISYQRNVEGKTWKQIIEGSSKPGGADVWGTRPSYKLGEWKHWIGSLWSGKEKDSL